MNSLKYLNYFKIFFLKYFFVIYIIFYITGPALINAFITIIAIFSIPLLLKNYQNLLKDRLILLLTVFFFYIFFKELYNYKNFNFDYFSFLRFYFVFLFIYFYINSISLNLIKYILLVVVLDGIFQFIFGFNILGYEIYESSRLTGFFDDEPIIGSFVMKFGSLFLLDLMDSNKSKNKYFLKIIFIFLVFTLVLISNERMPFLQILFMLFIVLFLFQINFSLKKYFVTFFIFLIISCTFYFSDTVKNRYLKSFYDLNQLILDLKENPDLHTSKKSSLKDYYLNFYSGIEIWKSNYIFGSGFRYYNSNCNNFHKSSYLEYGCSTHPHSIFIETLSDHGLVGLVILYSIFIYIILFSYKFIPINNLWPFLSLFVISFPFVTSQSLYSSYYGSIFWLFVYFCFFYIKLTKEKRNDLVASGGLEPPRE